MADADTKRFSYSDIGAALIKQSGIHEGKWLLLFDFSRANAFVGPTEGEMRQALAISVSSARLSRIDGSEKIAPPHLLLDASEINPRIRSTVERRRQPKNKTGSKIE